MSLMSNVWPVAGNGGIELYQVRLFWQGSYCASFFLADAPIGVDPPGFQEILGKLRHFFDMYISAVAFHRRLVHSLCSTTKTMPLTAPV